MIKVELLIQPDMVVDPDPYQCRILILNTRPVAYSRINLDGRNRTIVGLLI